MDKESALFPAHQLPTHWYTLRIYYGRLQKSPDPAKPPPKYAPDAIFPKLLYCISQNVRSTLLHRISLPEFYMAGNSGSTCAVMSVHFPDKLTDRVKAKTVDQMLENINSSNRCATWVGVRGTASTGVACGSCIKSHCAMPRGVNRGQCLKRHSNNVRMVVHKNAINDSSTGWG